jgi:hypothetical protein
MYSRFITIFTIYSPLLILIIPAHEKYYCDAATVYRQGITILGYQYLPCTRDTEKLHIHGGRRRRVLVIGMVEHDSLGSASIRQGKWGCAVVRGSLRLQ